MKRRLPVIAAALLLAASGAACQRTHPGGCVEIVGEKDGNTFAPDLNGDWGWVEQPSLEFIGYAAGDEDSTVWTTLACARTMPDYLP